MRTVIAGVPKAGKTTLANSMVDAGRVMHTDSLIGKYDWSECSRVVTEWMNTKGPWVIEGVAAGRALRKWMAANEGKPCDKVIWMPFPREELTNGQAGMGKGCHTVWNGIVDALRDRGVEVVTVTE